MWVEGITTQRVDCCINSAGFRSLSIDGEVPSLLTEAFEDDIQTLRDTELLYDQLNRVTDGLDQRTTFSGNTCTVVFRRDYIRIESDVREDSEPLEMSDAQYLVILDAWARFLQEESEGQAPA